MISLKNLRDNRQEKKAIRDNDRLFAEYFSKRDLNAAELQSLINNIDHPEIQEPLINNLSSFLLQKNLSTDMREDFVTKLSALPKTKEREDAIEQTEMDFSRNVTLIDRTPKKSAAEKLKEKIMNTYEAISERVRATRDVASERFATFKDDLKTNTKAITTTVSDKVKTKYTSFSETAVATGSVIGNRVKNLVQNLRDRTNHFANEVRVQKLSYENDRMLSDLLDKGVTANIIEEGIDNMDYPEIRYAMINNAPKVLSQESMTPELAEKFAATVKDMNMTKDQREAFDEAYKKLDIKPAEKVVEEEKPEVDSSFGFTEDGELDPTALRMRRFDENGRAVWGIEGRDDLEFSNEQVYHMLNTMTPELAKELQHGEEVDPVTKVTEMDEEEDLKLPEHSADEVQDELGDAMTPEEAQKEIKDAVQISLFDENAFDGLDDNPVLEY